MKQATSAVALLTILAAACGPAGESTAARAEPRAAAAVASRVAMPLYTDAGVDVCVREGCWVTLRTFEPSATSSGAERTSDGYVEEIEVSGSYSTRHEWIGPAKAPTRPIAQQKSVVTLTSAQRETVETLLRVRTGQKGRAIQDRGHLGL